MEEGISVIKNITWKMGTFEHESCVVFIGLALLKDIFAGYKILH